jgi:hypothetical protein
MNLGFGLYRHMLTPDYFAFARQVGATHVVVHMVDYFNNKGDATIRTTINPWANLEAGVTLETRAGYGRLKRCSKFANRSKLQVWCGRRSKTSTRPIGPMSYLMVPEKKISSTASKQSFAVSERLEFQLLATTSASQA